MSSGATLVELAPPPAKSTPAKRTAAAEPTSFIAGPENRLASFACTLEESIVEVGNPVLFYGPPGSGKTLLASILATHELSLHDGHSSRMLIEPASDFARRYSEAVDTDDIEAFRKRYNRASIWILEDVQQIGTRSAAQEEMIARIEERLEAERPLIATASRLPTEERRIRRGLASRLLQGLTVPVTYPAKDARLEILRQLARLRKIELSDANLEVLENSLPKRIAVRQLAAAIDTLRLQEKAQKKPTTSKQIRQSAGSIREAARPTASSITRAVAKRFRLKASELQGASRKQRIVRARSLAMFLCRDLTDMSLQQIGAHFGNRDHSTVLHAIRSIEQTLAEQTEVKRIHDETLDALRAS